MRSGTDLAARFYTGGTTGSPKGVMLSHSGLIMSALSLGALLGLRPSSVHYCGPPLFHIAAGMVIVQLALVGGTHLIIDRFDPATALAAMDKHRVTQALLVPSMIGMVLDRMEQGQTLPDLQTVVYGASPIAEALLRRAMAVFPHTRFFQVYGQTELSPAATLLSYEDHILEGPLARRLKSAGQAIPCCDVEVTDEAGRPLPQGGVGEIRVRGPNVMLGYWNLPQQTAATLVNGWCRTGDAGFFDEDRYLYVVDRVKDMIVSGGENVYSAEVENAVAKHSAVHACAVIGIPSERWGEEVHAIVILKEDVSLTVEALRAHCKELIADYKCPRSITIRREPLPHSAVGKVLKSELRAPFWGGKGRQVN